MHIIFCDEYFAPISSPADTFESLIWTYRWYIPGTFSIVMPEAYFTYAEVAEYIYNSDTQDYMIIDEYAIDSETNKLVVTGSSLESMLDWRPFPYDTFYPSQNIEAVIRNNVSFLTTDAVIADYAFTVVPIFLVSPHGYSDIGDIYIKTGWLLSDAIRYAYKPLGWAYTLKYDSGAIVFDTVVGLDRRSTQTVNQRAVFSTTIGDISTYHYSKNRKDHKNSAFLKTIWGYDSGTSTANGSNANVYNAAAAGEECRFAYLTGDTDYTAAQMDVLCAEEVLKYPVAENATGEISPNCTMIYGTDYSLGDICDFVINELGLIYSARITAVDFVYEKGAKRIIPIFGEEKLNPRRFIKREAGK